MAKYGYARVSTADQELDVQLEALERFGCDHIRSEKLSGSKPAAERPELSTLLAFLQEGDTLVVTKIDRLARSVEELLSISNQLDKRGVSLATVDGAVNTSTAAGRAFLEMLGVFAEFELNIRRERQMEGIAKAKERGVYRGRKPNIDVTEVRRLKEEGLGASEIARRLKIGRASVYRVLG